jgi:hypothetical protein
LVSKLSMGIERGVRAVGDGMQGAGAVQVVGWTTLGIG